MDVIATNRAIDRSDDELVRNPKRGRSVVGVIGIDAYMYWPRLRNAVNDATGFQDRLVAQFGFIQAFPPLLNQEATRDAILTTLNDRLRQFLKEDDELVLFFAGHGHTRETRVGGRSVSDGYIVPVEAEAGPDERWSQYVAIEPLLSETAKLAARHILVVLDACHSGFALGEVVKSYRGGSARYSNDLARRVSRKVITSAMRDQLAQDGGPVAGHSLFAGTLIDGLNWGAADLDGNGFITSSELGLFLQQRVGQSTGSKQTPDFGSFHLDDRGELLLSLQNQTFDALKARALASLQGGEFAVFRGLVPQLASLRPSSAEALYLEYRLRLLDRDFAAVIELARRMLALDPGKGTIPLSEHDLRTLTVVLPFWRRLLDLPEGDLPLQVGQLVGGHEGEMIARATTRIGEVEACEIGLGEAVELLVSNTANRQLHVYAVLVDPDGRLSFPSLWDDDDLLWNGLSPGPMQTSFPFALTTLGIWELRLYASPFRIRYFVSTPSTPTRAIHFPKAWDALDPSQIKVGLRRFSVRSRSGTLAGERIASENSRVFRTAAQEPLINLVTRIRLESAEDLGALPAERLRRIRDRIVQADLVHFVDGAAEADFVVRFNNASEIQVSDAAGTILLRRQSSMSDQNAVEAIQHLSVYRALRQCKAHSLASSNSSVLIVQPVERRGFEYEGGLLGTQAFNPEDDIPTFHSGETIVLKLRNQGKADLYVGVLFLGGDCSVNLVGESILHPAQEELVEVATFPEDGVNENLWLVKVIGSRHPEPYSDFVLPALGNSEFRAGNTLGLPAEGWEVSELLIRERMS